MNQFQDNSSWENFRQGDMTVLRAMYEQYFHMLYEYGMRLNPDKEMVKDSIQDLFLKLWNSRTKLGAVQNTKSYLLVSYRNLVFNNLQKKQKKAFVALREDADFLLVFSAESDYIKNETSSIKSREVAGAMNGLSARQKEIIYLRYFEELAYDEIAAIMDISVKATYKLSARALDALREILKVPRSSLFLLFTLIKIECVRF